MAYKPFALSLIGTIPIDLTSLDAGAAAGPIVDNYRNSASPAASDILGGQIFYGKDSAANKQEYARYETRIIDTTSTAEKGAWALYTTSAGTATKQIDALDTGCQIRGNNTNTAPPAGYIGENIQSVIASGSAVALSSTVAANITSISLTAGIWDVTGIIQFNPDGSYVGSHVATSISTVSATVGTIGDNRFQGLPPTAAVNQQSVSVPSYRLTLSSTTTVYLVGESSFSAGAISAYGRITATRVG